MREFAQLKDSIPHILTYRAGFTVPAELSAKGDYDVMHYCTYRNEEAVKQYAVHPAHQRFIGRNRASWEKVLVINSTFRP
ncbi:MAG: stress protein [Spirosoma sp.]|nr:stress protein [Spirosoma sp.]